MINWAALKGMVSPDHIKVLELSPSLTVDQVKSGTAHIQSLWGAE